MRHINIKQRGTGSHNILIKLPIFLLSINAHCIMLKELLDIRSMYYLLDEFEDHEITDSKDHEITDSKVLHLIEFNRFFHSSSVLLLHVHITI